MVWTNERYVSRVPYRTDALPYTKPIGPGPRELATILLGLPPRGSTGAVVATNPVSVDAAALTSDCRRVAAGPTGYYEEDRKGGIMAEPIYLKCPSCGQILAAADESGLVNVLQEHLYEEHALDMPLERVRENVVAQLRAFDGYNARPISGA